MHVVFHSNFAEYTVYPKYKPCEFLGWTDCWGDKSYYVTTSPMNGGGKKKQRWAKNPIDR